MASKKKKVGTNNRSTKSGTGAPCHCLFCLDTIIPYSVSSPFCNNSVTSENEGPGTPNLQQCCKMLNILFPDDHHELLKAFENPCDKFLCLCCFERMEQLSKLQKELEIIQQQIVATTTQVLDIIKQSDDDDNNLREKVFFGVGGSGPPRKRGRIKKDNGSYGKDLFEFVRMFHQFVKEGATSLLRGDDDPAQQSVPTPPSTTKRAKKIKYASASKTLTVTTPKLEPIEEPVLTPLPPCLVEEPSVDIKLEIIAAVEEDITNDTDDFFTDDLLNDDNDELVDTPTDKLLPTTTTQVEMEAAMSTEKNNFGSETKPRRSTRSHRKTVKDNSTKRKRGTKKNKLKSQPEISSQQLTCRFCNATFSNHSQYFTHRRTHIPSIKSLGITTLYDPDDPNLVTARVCPICDYTVKGRKFYNFMEHMLSHETNYVDQPTSLHSCDLCDKRFAIKLNLDIHKFSGHSDRIRATLRCEFCDNQDCKTQDEFVEHLKSHCGDTTTIYRCKTCAFAGTSLDNLLAHMVKHRVSKRLMCPVCPIDYPTMKELYDHCHQAHSDLKQKFGCDECNKSFMNAKTLEVHKKRSHSDVQDPDEMLVCLQCNNGKVYKCKDSLKQHINRMHGDETVKPYKCDQCDKAFVYQSLLQLHIDEKHEKIRFPCPHCSKFYTTRVQLNLHLKTHTGEGLHTCESCGKQFPTQQRLKIHSIVHLEKNENTKCVCDTCGKEFSHPVFLKNHMDIHKEKRLKCQYCEMMFRRRDHLKGHLRTHTGERPFCCPICTKGFNRRDILLVHMRMHGYNSYEEASKAYDSYKEKQQL